jgi:2-hydroxymuconate-semialdehyde hydrolase
LNNGIIKFLNYQNISRCSFLIIAAPALILSGENDELVPSQNSAILKKLMPHAELHMFSACRHGSFIKAAAKCNQKIIQFIRANL